MAPLPMMQTRFIVESRSPFDFHQILFPVNFTLQGAEQTVGIVERILDKDLLVKQRILQGGGNSVYGSGSPLAHALGPAVAMGRGGSDVAVLHVWHVHRRDGQVVAEGVGQHVAYLVVGTIFKQCSADPMRSCAINLSFHDSRINYGSAVIDRDVVENLRDEGFPVNLNYRDVELGSVGHGEIAVLFLRVRDLEGRSPDI